LDTYWKPIDTNPKKWSRKDGSGSEIKACDASLELRCAGAEIYPRNTSCLVIFLKSNHYSTNVEYLFSFLFCATNSIKSNMVDSVKP
jgi:hypothetical protein